MISCMETYFHQLLSKVFCVPAVASSRRIVRDMYVSQGLMLIKTVNKCLHCCIYVCFKFSNTAYNSYRNQWLDISDE
jgi:hypothetical protein